MAKITIIFLIACIARMVSLASVPQSLTMDEVAIGYNAYSILQTGRDEWGELLPLAFRSVGDYKPPVNIYLTSLSIFLFGLNEWAVRLPSALMGSLSVLALMYLLRQLKFKEPAILFGGLWLAINPWHIHFSRSGFEAVTALFFVILGAATLLHFYKSDKPKYLLFSILCFALSIWSYHATRVFAPLLFIFIVWQFGFKKLRVLPKNHKLFATVLGSVLVIPFLYLTLATPAIRQRAESTSILREQALVQGLHDTAYAGIGDYIFNNDGYEIFRHWAGKYLNYYDLRFWFWKGLGFTPPGYPDVGLFYLVDLPLILFGIYAVWTSKNKLLRHLGIFWFFTGPLAASLTMNEQHTLRALVWLPFFALAAVSGFEKLFYTKRKLLLIWVPLLILNILYFADIYTRHYSRYSAEFRGFGFKEIALFTCNEGAKYDEIVVSHTYGSDGPIFVGIPYAYILFYCKVNPQELMANNHTINKISFRKPDWSSDQKRVNTALVASPWELDPTLIPQEYILQKIYYPNGKLAFVFVQTHGD